MGEEFHPYWTSREGIFQGEAFNKYINENGMAILEVDFDAIELKSQPVTVIDTVDKFSHQLSKILCKRNKRDQTGCFIRGDLTLEALMEKENYTMEGRRLLFKNYRIFSVSRHLVIHYYLLIDRLAVPLEVVLAHARLTLIESRGVEEHLARMQGSHRRAMAWSTKERHRQFFTDIQWSEGRQLLPEYFRAPKASGVGERLHSFVTHGWGAALLARDVLSGDPIAVLRTTGVLVGLPLANELFSQGLLRFASQVEVRLGENVYSQGLRRVAVHVGTGIDVLMNATDLGRAIADLASSSDAMVRKIAKVRIATDTGFLLLDLSELLALTFLGEALGPASLIGAIALQATEMAVIAKIQTDSYCAQLGRCTSAEYRELYWLNVLNQEMPRWLQTDLEAKALYHQVFEAMSRRYFNESATDFLVLPTILSLLEQVTYSYDVKSLDGMHAYGYCEEVTSRQFRGLESRGTVFGSRANESHSLLPASWGSPSPLLKPPSGASYRLGAASNGRHVVQKTVTTRELRAQVPLRNPDWMSDTEHQSRCHGVYRERDILWSLPRDKDEDPHKDIVVLEKKAVKENHGVLKEVTYHHIEAVEPECPHNNRFIVSEGAVLKGCDDREATDDFFLPSGVNFVGIDGRGGRNSLLVKGNLSQSHSESIAHIQRIEGVLDKRQELYIPRDALRVDARTGGNFLHTHPQGRALIELSGGDTVHVAGRGNRLRINEGSGDVRIRLAEGGDVQGVCIVALPFRRVQKLIYHRVLRELTLVLEGSGQTERRVMIQGYDRARSNMRFVLADKALSRHAVIELIPHIDQSIEFEGGVAIEDIELHVSTTEAIDASTLANQLRALRNPAFRLLKTAQTPKAKLFIDERPRHATGLSHFISLSSFISTNESEELYFDTGLEGHYFGIDAYQKVTFRLRDTAESNSTTACDLLDFSRLPGCTLEAKMKSEGTLVIEYSSGDKRKKGTIIFPDYKKHAKQHPFKLLRDKSASVLHVVAKGDEVEVISGNEGAMRLMLLAKDTLTVANASDITDYTTLHLPQVRDEKELRWERYQNQLILTHVPMNGTVVFRDFYTQNTAYNVSVPSLSFQWSRSSLSQEAFVSRVKRLPDSYLELKDAFDARYRLYPPVNGTGAVDYYLPLEGRKSPLITIDDARCGDIGMQFRDDLGALSVTIARGNQTQRLTVHHISESSELPVLLLNDGVMDLRSGCRIVPTPTSGYEHAAPGYVVVGNKISVVPEALTQMKRIELIPLLAVGDHVTVVDLSLVLTQNQTISEVRVNERFVTLLIDDLVIAFSLDTKERRNDVRFQLDKKGLLYTLNEARLFSIDDDCSDVYDVTVTHHNEGRTAFIDTASLAGTEAITTPLSGLDRGTTQAPVSPVTYVIEAEDLVGSVIRVPLSASLEPVLYQLKDWQDNPLYKELLLYNHDEGGRRVDTVIRINIRCDIEHLFFLFSSNPQSKAVSLKYDSQLVNLDEQNLYRHVVSIVDVDYGRREREANSARRASGVPLSQKTKRPTSTLMASSSSQATPLRFKHAMSDETSTLITTQSVVNKREKRGLGYLSSLRGIFGNAPQEEASKTSLNELPQGQMNRARLQSAPASGNQEYPNLPERGVVGMPDYGLAEFRDTLEVVRYGQQLIGRWFGGTNKPNGKGSGRVVDIGRLISPSVPLAISLRQAVEVSASKSGIAVFHINKMTTVFDALSQTIRSKLINEQSVDIKALIGNGRHFFQEVINEKQLNKFCIHFKNEVRRLIDAEYQKLDEPLLSPHTVQFN